VPNQDVERFLRIVAEPGSRILRARPTGAFWTSQDCTVPNQVATRAVAIADPRNNESGVSEGMV